MNDPEMRPMTIIAQDPSVKKNGSILRAQVQVPYERLRPGPTGYRVKVIDYDASTSTLYQARANRDYEERRGPRDPYAHAADRTLLNDPRFHAQNVYAIVMRTLARFEFALGRRVNWSFDGHQIHAAPHAFDGANAFYSRDARGLLFGYFAGALTGKTVFSCLSHDVIAHETSHALLDGLRERYLYPSSPDQAAFHEGFADLVALLSILSVPELVEHGLDYADATRKLPGSDSGEAAGMTPRRRERMAPAQRRGARALPAASNLIHKSCLTLESLRGGFLTGLAVEMGQEMSGIRGQALRNAVDLIKNPSRYAKMKEPHERGRIFLAAMMGAVLEIWRRRLAEISLVESEFYNRRQAAEQGAEAAHHLLTISIRALDYAPATDLEFGEFLSAILTADREMYPDDRLKYREALRKSFASHYITPASRATSPEIGIWEPPGPPGRLTRGNTHFESLQRDRDEVFKFVWENRRALGIDEDAYTRVISVLPCQRVGSDGFVVRETVGQYYQTMRLRADELQRTGIRPPKGMKPWQMVTLYGGGALVFDEFGTLKFHVRNRILNAAKQQKRLQHLYEGGYYTHRALLRDFADLHRRRAMRVRPERDMGV